MASLFATGIVSICAAMANGQYNQACNKAMDAGTRQLGWRQTADSTEDKTNHLVTTKFQEYTPKEMQDVVGAGAFAYKVAKEKKVNLKLPTLGICNSVNSQISPSNYGLTMQWILP